MSLRMGLFETRVHSLSQWSPPPVLETTPILNMIVGKQGKESQVLRIACTGHYSRRLAGIRNSSRRSSNII